VVSCGGGLLTTEEARNFLKYRENVIFIDRDFNDINEELENSD
jgi:shikimate kinase